MEIPVGTFPLDRSHFVYQKRKRGPSQNRRRNYEVQYKSSRPKDLWKGKESEESIRTVEANYENL